MSYRVFILFSALFIFSTGRVMAASNNPYSWWEVQSIDTMKFSRDPSREFLSHPDRGTEVIEQQVKQVASTGATHIAIATPYDAEFLPLLKQWVAESRKYNLKVWFRGNWSGWERWFDYPRISRAQHLQRTDAFILAHPELFEDGDIFTGCPECENGGPGDPRMINDKAGHTKFLIDEFKVSTEAFAKIGKKVDVNFNSMNGDVAKLVMDPASTAAMGGLVVVDHYVRSPQQLAKDMAQYGKNSDANVALGEFGAPIPDIHGNMTQEQQAAWLDEALKEFTLVPSLTGLNYWTGVGGSTAIWNDDGSERKAVAVLTKYFKPPVISGSVVDLDGNPQVDVLVKTNLKSTTTDEKGAYTFPYIEKTGHVIFSKADYKEKATNFEQLSEGQIIILEEEKTSFWVKTRRFLQNLF